MKLCGIVAEFNPLTNGHDYIIKEVKRLTGEDVIIIMSGNFTQRGELAMFDKYTRSAHAILSGASLVVELPTCFALSSAKYFAYGAVKILSDIGVDSLAFGVKIDDTSYLEKVAQLKANEDSKTSKIITNYIKAGLNYSKAICETYKKLYPELSSALDQIFTEPNNILAVEYLSAIYSMNIDIKPIYIKRLDSGYNQNKIVKVKINNKPIKLINATYIRGLAGSKNISKIKNLVPETTYKNIKTFSQQQYETAETKLDAIIVSKLRNQSKNDLEQYADYNTALSSLVETNSKLYATRKEICDSLESKCYRRSRINKLLLLPYFEIKKDFVNILNKPYAVNVLAVSSHKKVLLSKLIKTSKTKLIVSCSDKQNLSTDKCEFIRQNQIGSNLYNIVFNKTYNQDKTIFIS